MSKGKVIKFDSANIKNKAKQAKGRHKVFLLLLLIAFIALGTLLVKSEIRIHKLQTERKAEEDRNARLISTKEDLQAELDSINTDEYIERLARRDLQLIKPNELLFILPKAHKYTSEDIESEDYADKAEDIVVSENEKIEKSKDKAALEQEGEDDESSTED